MIPLRGASRGRTTRHNSSPAASTLPARTLETDRRCHERAAEWIGDVRLNRLTLERVRKLMSELTASGYAPETVARTMRWVRLTFNQAVRDRRIAVSPAEGIRLPKVRRSEVRLLDVDAVNDLAAALPDRYGTIAIVAAYIGLRWGELAGLRVADIDMLRRRLSVRSALVEASGQPPIDPGRPQIAGLRANHHAPSRRRRRAGAPPP